MKANPWLRMGITVGAILFVFAAAATYRFLDSHGLFTAVHPGFSGTCQVVAGAPGPADIAVDADGKTAFLAAKGGLYLYAYDTPGAKPVRLSGTPKDFNPRGLSLHRGPGGLSLIVVNRRSDGDFAIDIFNFEDGKLAFVGAIGSDQLIDPADVAAVDEDRFYVVNAHTSRTALGRWLDDVLLLPRANVLFFDGMKFVTVAEELNSSRGAAVLGKHLFVTEQYPRTLLSFERDPYSGQLKEAQAFPIASGLDKITVAPDGRLWIAGQPKAFAGNPAPSQVYRVDLEAGVPHSVARIYADEGEHISGANAAAKAGNRLLIGSERDGKLLVCKP